jgi:tetratricopeptide (TPR) repeat protein
VLHGRCDEDIAIAYRPIRECLSYYLTSVPEGRLAGHDRQSLGEISRLVPELARRMPDLPQPTQTDPDVEQYLLFSAVAGLLDEIAATAPVALVLDDLHWADRPTLQLVRHVANVGQGRMMILGTYRHGEVAGHPLAEALAVLCREPTVEDMGLEGLAEPAVSAIIAAMTGGPPDEKVRHLAADLARDTDGNAFLVVEQVRHLRQTGILVRGGSGKVTLAADRASATLPHTVQQMVAGRLGLLGEEAGRVLSVASAIGEQFDLDLLAAANDCDEGRVLDVLEAAARRTLVSEEAARSGSFRFVHAMVRQAVYHEMGATRRARLHARIGDALERMCGQEPADRTAELARHFLAGPSTDALKAARYARLAGERALAALAPDQAVRWFDQALTALDGIVDNAERARCLVGLGDAQSQVGVSNARLTLLEGARMARRVNESNLVIRAALASSRGLFARVGQLDQELVALLEDALVVCPSDSPNRARLLSRLAAELTWHPDTAQPQAVAHQAVAAARACDDDAALLDALTRPDTALMIPELSDLRLSRLREAQALAQLVGDPVTGFWATYQLALLLVERADRDGMNQAVERAGAIAMKVGHPALRWASSMARCCQALLAGDVEAAERLANESLEVGTDGGQPDAQAMYFAHLICIRLHQGRLDEVIPVLTQLVPELPDQTGMRSTLAYAEAVAGDSEQARRLLQAASDAGFAVPRTAGWLVSTCMWAEATAELGLPDAAVVLYQQLLPWHHLFAATGSIPLHCVAHSLGRLAALQGRLQDAEEHFAEALTVHRRIRAPFCIAATQLAWGQLLLPDDSDRAGPLLESAASIAARHGYRYLQRPPLSTGGAPSRAVGSESG